MPLKNRNIQKSVMAYVRSLFASPPVGSGLNAHTVYGEDDLVSINQKRLTPKRPYVFVLTTYMRPEKSNLPMVVVELSQVTKKPFELGNRNGRTSDLFIHSFGRQRGETEDFASFLQDNFGPVFPVYDYSTTSGSFVENAEVDAEIDVENHIPSSDAVRQEGSLDLWQIISLRFRTKT